MTCKYSRCVRVQGGGFQEFHYTCDEVRKLHRKWKREFKFLSPYLKYHEEYCKEIDDFLEKCKCLGDKPEKPKRGRPKK